MNRQEKKPLPKIKKKVVINTKPTCLIVTRAERKENLNGKPKTYNGGTGATRQARRKEGCSLNKEKSISDMITDLILDDRERENCLDLLTPDDIRKKPDLWMAAFDNPIEFIQYCRKRLDHEKELLEKSRRVEEEVRQFVQEWTNNTNKHTAILDDLFKVQAMNDKLQVVVMEERTHCQHLVGLNDQLASDKLALQRKYQAALLLGKVDEKSVKHLLEKNPKAVVLVDKMGDLHEQLKRCNGKADLRKVSSDPVVLAERVVSLELFVDDLIRQHREEVSVLKDTVSLNELQLESFKAQYTDALKFNTSSLKELKEVLGVTMRENLDLREELVRRENTFLDAAEHEIHRSISTHRHNLHYRTASNPEILVPYCEGSTSSNQELQLRLTKSESALAKSTSQLREVSSKVISLERKCSRLEEENYLLKKTHEHTVNALKERNVMLEKRCERSESRRKLENEGTQRECAQVKKVVTLLDKNFKELIRKTERRNKDVIKKEALEHPEELQINRLDNVQSPVVLARTKSELLIQAMTAWCEYLNQKAQRIPEIQYANRKEIKDIEFIEITNEDENGVERVRHFRDHSTEPRKEEVEVLYRQGQQRGFPRIIKEKNESPPHSTRTVWPYSDRTGRSNFDFWLNQGEHEEYNEPDTPPELD